MVTARLRAQQIAVGYTGRPVLSDLTVVIPPGEFTAIVGPNACGKSTLLRALARMLPVRTGEVLLNERVITTYQPKEVARILGLLPQSPVAPDGIVVRDLVSRGRYPHQSMFRQWSAADEAAVDTAMAQAQVTALADRFVQELSGGQRQRVWIAMVLAQQTPLLLLDEPTTYLDLAHQVEVLNLAQELQQCGVTVVVVLHELNLAFRYATHVVMMREGDIQAQGAPRDVVTAELIEQVFDVPCLIIDDPVTHTPLVIPSELPGQGLRR